MKASNQSMKPTAPFRNKFSRVCHDTLPWLISFSLDDEKLRTESNATKE
jgi:hypothetical protein